VRSWLAAAGAPLVAPDTGRRAPPLTRVLAAALPLAHPDATVARALPLLLWRWRDQLDLESLRQEVYRQDEGHSLGVTVTITNDEWGAGMCHILVADKHCRTFLIENGSTSTIYSRLAIFNGPEPGCGAYGPGGATGDPYMLSGPTSIPAGGAGTVSYCVDVTPDKCNRIQVDDSWGPFGVFVVGDVFNFTRACSLPAPTTPPTVPPGPTVTPGPTVGPTVTPGPTAGPTVTPGPTVGPTVAPGP